MPKVKGMSSKPCVDSKSDNNTRSGASGCHVRIGWRLCTFSCELSGRYWSMLLCRGPAAGADLAPAQGQGHAQQALGLEITQ